MRCGACRLSLGGGMTLPNVSASRLGDLAATPSSVQGYLEDAGVLGGTGCGLLQDVSSRVVPRSLFQ
jgi:hypothetical protein